MRHTALAACLIGVALAGNAMPAAAHHSYGMFDRTKIITVNGTVADWQWTNPHCYLVVASVDAKGKETKFSLEGASPGVLRTLGWNRTMVKIGDKVVVQFSPLRSGQPGGQIVSVTAANGTNYGFTPNKS